MYRRRSRMPAVALAAAAGLLLAAASHADHAGASHAATAPAGPVSHAAREAIAYARHQIGCPYVWAGNGPCSAGYDCSGLVTAAYASAGVGIPRTSEQEWASGHRVARPRPGDLVFFAGIDGTTTSPGHVGLVIGHGRMIEAYGVGYPIRVASYGGRDPVGFTRPSAGER